MNNDFAEFLQKYKYLIEQDNFEDLYKYATEYDFSSQLTMILQQAGINPLLYMNQIPAKFAEFLQDVHFVIPDHITMIDHDAFSGSDIQSVTIPETCKLIKYCAFEHCNDLTTVIFKPGCEKIELQAFYRCNLLKTVNLPETLKVIGQAVFFADHSVEHIKLPNSLARIDQESFSKTGLHEIEIPQSCGELGVNAFYDCNNMKTAVIHGGDIIYSGAFKSCKNLEKVVFGNNGSHFAPNIFDEDSPPKTFYVPKSNKYVLDYCKEHYFNIQLI